MVMAAIAATAAVPVLRPSHRVMPTGTATEYEINMIDGQTTRSAIDAA